MNTQTNVRPLNCRYGTRKAGRRLHQIGIALGIAALCATPLLCGRMAHAARFAPPTVTGIYIYNGSGEPINMTGIDSYQEPHIFDQYNNLIGTVDDDDMIYNSGGTAIGYVTVPAG